MIWQIPNGTPLQNFTIDAYLKYRTTSGFLKPYGGNLFRRYKDFFPIISRVSNTDGPAIPVTFDKGNATEVVSHFGVLSQPGIEGGYIQVFTF